MASEVCKICGDDSTPWVSIEELRGHVCRRCAEDPRAAILGQVRGLRVMWAQVNGQDVSREHELIRKILGWAAYLGEGKR